MGFAITTRLSSLYSNLELTQIKIKLKLKGKRIISTSSRDGDVQSFIASSHDIMFSKLEMFT